MSEFRHSSLKLSSGLRLHCAEHGDEQGEPWLFLHGWPDSWFSFSRVAELLPDRFRTLLLDQRGFGDSDRPPRGYAIEDFATDATAFLDALGCRRATIVGHSFGSFVARCLAFTHPDRVSRLVLIGTGLTPSNAVTREVGAALPAIEDEVPVDFAREFQAGTVYAPVPMPFFERIVSESLKLPASLWHETFERLLEYDDVDRLGGIAAPTLLLWGERDALFPRSDQDTVRSAIPRAELRVYAETGHCPNWERPADVAADLEAFARRDPRT